MHKLTFSFAFIFVLVSSQLFADQVVLKNGDKLTGTIVDSDGKTLTLKSESVGQVQDSKFVGEVKIQWDAIQLITSSQPLAVTSKDGKVVTGNVTTKDSTFDVQTPTSGEVAVAKDVVTAVRSKEQQSAYEEETYRKEHPRLRDFWTGTINTGLAIARGNIETLDYNLSAKAVRDAPKDKLSLYGLVLYSNVDCSAPSSKCTSTNPTNPTITTANLIGGGGRIDFNLGASGKWFAFGQLDLLHNPFQQLRLRVAPAGGLGLHAIKSENTTLDLSLGGGLNQEYFTNVPNQTSGELLLGEVLTHNFSKAVTFDEGMQFFPNLTDTGEFRYNFTMGLNTKLTKILSWQITFANIYLSNPPPGTKTSDGVLTTGLSVTWGKKL
jgi:putative salt-induced outer membrane protein YdiY